MIAVQSTRVRITKELYNMLESHKYSLIIHLTDGSKHFYEIPHHKALEFSRSKTNLLVGEIMDIG